MVLGYEHLDVAKTLGNIAIVYRNQGKYDEALVEYHKAEKVFVSVWLRAPGRGQ